MPATRSVYTLGAKARDKATGLKGTLTLLAITLSGDTEYFLQPKGLSPKTGEPVKGLWLSAPRVECDETSNLEVPSEILGTHVKDMPTGFEGMATHLVFHINGCVHVEVQAKGTQETGAPIAAQNFDTRRLEGPAIKKLTEQEKKVSHATKPSPCGDIAVRGGSFRDV